MSQTKKEYRNTENSWYSTRTTYSGTSVYFYWYKHLSPWEIVTRKTWGGAANSKRWAKLFTCLVSRAIHIEIVEEMSSSSSINALRSFLALRGQVKLIRSDRGTDFIGASEEMKIDTIKIENGPIQQFLQTSGNTWKFNVPHASHMGCIWERMLVTFMCEVCAIINSRPITLISTDPDEPLIISPSIILTRKVDFLPVVSDSLDIKDIQRAQWKHVQVLADIGGKNTWTSCSLDEYGRIDTPILKSATLWAQGTSWLIVTIGCYWKNLWKWWWFSALSRSANDSWRQIYSLHKTSTWTSSFVELNNGVSVYTVYIFCHNFLTISLKVVLQLNQLLNRVTAQVVHLARHDIFKSLNSSCFKVLILVYLKCKFLYIYVLTCK